MKNVELKALIKSELKSNNVVENAKIEYAQHGNGYCVCVRVPRENGGRTEYSLPATFKVYGIQNIKSIKERIKNFFKFYSYLISEN